MPSGRSASASPRLLVVGAGVAGQSLVREIQTDGLPAVPVAFLDDDPTLIGTEVCGLPVLGRTEELVEIAARVEIVVQVAEAAGRAVDDGFESVPTDNLTLTEENTPCP